MPDPKTSDPDKANPKANAQLQELHVGGSADAWRAIGFVGGGAVRIGNTIVHPTGGEQAIDGMVLDGVDELDGLSLCASLEKVPTEQAQHPNGVVAIDHVVVTTPDASRTQAAFESAGIETRRVRTFETSKGDRRQAFHWFGDVVCEVAGPVEPNGSGPAALWGLALTVRDIDETASYLGDRASTVKDAVQPGRRVTTLRSSAGIPTPILFISAHLVGS